MNKQVVTREPSIDRKFSERDRVLASSSDSLKTRHELYLGDARDMKELADRSVHLVVTSPPYWTLKQYDGAAGERQLGHHEDYEGFHDELASVWQRCYRNLVPGGRLCIVIGDVCLPRRQGGRHLVMPLHSDIISRCRRTGFDYLTPILWHKIANAVTEVEGNGSAFLGKPYEPNAIIKNDVEYILLFRKPGGYRNPTQNQRLLSLIDKSDHARWFRSIWTDLPGATTRAGHPAPFPVELAYRLIRMFSFVGDLVLDPFVGSGSTTEAAIKADRSSIGFEVEPQYYKLLRRKFSQHRMGAEIRFPQSGESD
jgi:site-specific DNA-methyltransferase (adenine-specific)